MRVAVVLGIILLGFVSAVPVHDWLVKRSIRHQEARWKTRLNRLLGQSRPTVKAAVLKEGADNYETDTPDYDYSTYNQRTYQFRVIGKSDVFRVNRAGNTIFPPLDYWFDGILKFDKRGRLISYEVVEDASGL